MSVLEKLLNIQQKLKAPKGQFNKFGNFNYRSCEDILEAVKPLLMENKCVLTMTDEIVEVGGRIYVKSIGTLADAESGETIANTAFAREPDEKKGMDTSQVTGTASSYCRKYMLNGLFAIDDTKDTDTEEYQKVTNPKPKQAPQQAPQQQRPPKNFNYVVTLTNGEVGIFNANGQGPYPLSKLDEKSLEAALGQPRYAAAAEAIKAELTKRGNEKIPF